MKFKTQYLKNKGIKSCPRCNTKNKDFIPELTGLTNPKDEDFVEAFVNYDTNEEEVEIYQDWKCNICNQSWRDIYRLSDVVPILKPIARVINPKSKEKR